MPTADHVYDYSVYWAELDGTPVPKYPPTKVALGFWRKRERSGKDVGLAIFEDKGRVSYKVGHDDVRSFHSSQAESNFSYSYLAYCKAVPEEHYRRWLVSGEWPEPGIGHNSEAAQEPLVADQPPHVALHLRIASLNVTFVAWMESNAPIDTQEKADAAANFQREFLALEQEANTAREAARAPHLLAASEQQAVWMPLVNLAKTAKADAADLVSQFLAREQARKLQEAAAKAAAGEAVRAKDLVVQAGTKGRKVSQRVRTSVEITDAKLLQGAYVHDPRFWAAPGVVDALMELAKIDLTAKKEVAGARLTTTATAS